MITPDDTPNEQSPEESTREQVVKLAAQLEDLLAKVAAQQKRTEDNAAWEQEWRELRRREVAAREKQAEALAQIAAVMTLNRQDANKP